MSEDEPNDGPQETVTETITETVSETEPVSPAPDRAEEKRVDVGQNQQADPSVPVNSGAQESQDPAPATQTETTVTSESATGEAPAQQ